MEPLFEEGHQTTWRCREVCIKNDHNAIMGPWLSRDIGHYIATDSTRPIQPVHAHYLKLFMVSAIAHPILLPLGRITRTGNSSFSRHMQYQLSTNSSSMVTLPL